ncbi:hypothetical protein F4678DRAFT_452058 [Xylaria arbuscula]|nr:hypothetical protein F4678DRAFT_452058 [Xylaria arbuscula]
MYPTELFYKDSEVFSTFKCTIYLRSHYYIFSIAKMQTFSMLSAVLLSATLHGLNRLLSESLFTVRFWDALERDPVCHEYMIESRKHLRAATDAVDTSIVNETETAISVKPTINITDSIEYHEQSWPRIIKRALGAFFARILLGPLLYSWDIWLERLLPSRPLTGRQTAAINSDDKREEPVTRKWLRRVMILPTSIRWRNVFAKWTIQWTLGRYWMDNADLMVEDILFLENPLRTSAYRASQVLFDLTCN